MHISRKFRKRNYYFFLVTNKDKLMKKPFLLTTSSLRTTDANATTTNNVRASTDLIFGPTSPDFRTNVRRPDFRTGPDFSNGDFRTSQHWPTIAHFSNGDFRTSQHLPIVAIFLLTMIFERRNTDPQLPTILFHVGGRPMVRRKFRRTIGLPPTWNKMVHLQMATFRNEE